MSREEQLLNTVIDGYCAFWSLNGDIEDEHETRERLGALVRAGLAMQRIEKFLVSHNEELRIGLSYGCGFGVKAFTEKSMIEETRDTIPAAIEAALNAAGVK